MIHAIILAILILISAPAHAADFSIRTTDIHGSLRSPLVSTNIVFTAPERVDGVEFTLHWPAALMVLNDTVTVAGTTCQMVQGPPINGTVRLAVVCVPGMTGTSRVALLRLTPMHTGSGFITVSECRVSGLFNGTETESRAVPCGLHAGRVAISR